MPTKNDKLWAGRFTGGNDPLTDAFNSSLGADKRLYRQDIEGSLAHAAALQKGGALTAAEYAAIETGLKSILNDVKSGKLAVENAEDVHMFVESCLTEKIGAAGKKLHTGRSRNDQVATDMRLYMRGAAQNTIALLKDLIGTVLTLAEKHAAALMPAYTHMQKAQPVTLGHYLCAYAEMFLRDLQRFADGLKRADVCPLGSGAAAGTTFPVDRALTAKLLGFPAYTRNSMDAVSDRDYLIEFAANASICMAHLSRICEEFILWSTGEFNFVKISDAYSTGSSMMPQKRNPDVAELIRGKTGRVYGDLTALLTLVKGLPLTYNKDLQEDKEAVFDVCDTLEMCLKIFAKMLPAAEFNLAAMEKAADGGFMAATDMADYLASKNIPFRDAHGIIGKIVKHCEETGKTLRQLPLSELQSFSPAFAADIVELLKPETMVKRRDLPGGPSPDRVRDNVRAIRGLL
ncbi:MAG: argininosuccinate lyase [Clostridiales bacterium]|jgi:argininosuccinate lyase|nr:argininosuccinate lyase [Clostridiales bacterium]